MLKRVFVENFILIRDLEIEFEEGLNVISGETGTGKSMTISAIEFVMGKQGDYPEGTAVEIEFEIDGEPALLRREIKRGKSRYYLNGRGTTAKTVREILESRVSIQGQNEFIKLLKPDFQRDILDKFGNLLQLRNRVEKIYTEYVGKKRFYDELVSRKEDILQKRDFLEFKLREIEEIGLKPEEVSELKERAETLKNLEKIKRYIHEVLQYLYDSEGSAYSDISNALKVLWKVREHDKSVEGIVEELTLLKDRLSEIVESLRNNDLDLSPEEIDYINEVLFKVQRLEKKYGKSYAEIIKDAEEIKKELATSYSYDERIEDIEEELERLMKNLMEESEKLSIKRREVAHTLKQKIEKVLKELNLEKAKFDIDIKRKEPGRFGFDQVTFLFSSYGRDVKPLEDVASGGELTRLFLALALILPPTETYVFDEVDIGVSGETSVKLARLLKRLARSMQLIVITHSAPICAAGDVNFVTEKVYLGDIPYIRVRKLTVDEKLREVARLMGRATENTIKGARELMEIVENIR